MAGRCGILPPGAGSPVRGQTGGGGRVVVRGGGRAGAEQQPGQSGGRQYAPRERMPRPRPGAVFVGNPHLWASIVRGWGPRVVSYRPTCPVTAAPGVVVSQAEVVPAAVPTAAADPV